MLTAEECLGGQFVISCCQCLAVISQVDLTATDDASLREVEHLQIAIGLLALLVDTAQATNLTQVSTINISGNLQRTHSANLLVVQYGVQRTSLSEFDILL